MTSQTLVRICRVLGRLACLLLGIVILQTISPHGDGWLTVWRMEEVQSELVEDGTTIQAQIAPFKWEIRFSSTTLRWVACLVLACLICLSRRARNAVMEFVQKRRQFLTIMVPFFWLFLVNTTWAFVILLAGLLLVSAPSLRKNQSAILKDARLFLLRLSAIFIFLFTLKPTPDGWPMVLHLIFGSFGILFVLIGTYPLLRCLAKRARGPEIGFIMMVQRLCRFFHTVRPAFFLIFFFLAFILTNLGSYFLFEHIPHVTDSIKQVFHGKTFATGRLAAPSHPLKEFFDFRGTMNDMRGDGKWYSEYPPGHSFLMMLGALISAPWLINPLLGSATVLLLYYLGKELYDERTGRLAVLLGVLSPFVMIMSSAFDTM